MDFGDAADEDGAKESAFVDVLINIEGTLAVEVFLVEEDEEVFEVVLKVVVVVEVVSVIVLVDEAGVEGEGEAFFLPAIEGVGEEVFFFFFFKNSIKGVVSGDVTAGGWGSRTTSS